MRLGSVLVPFHAVRADRYHCRADGTTPISIPRTAVAFRERKGRAAVG